MAAGSTYRDEGITLVETLVAMMLLSIIGAVMLGALVSTHRTFRVDDDEARGLADVRTVVERLGRDVRDARSVVCDGAAADPVCKNHLQLWVDYNANYKQDAGETVTWRLQPSTSPGHYSMLRAVDTGVARVQALTIVQDVAFTYDYAPGATAPSPGAPHTSEVHTDMTYDPVIGSASGTRSVSFTTRLRNVA